MARKILVFEFPRKNPTYFTRRPGKSHSAWTHGRGKPRFLFQPIRRENQGAMAPEDISTGKEGERVFKMYCRLSGWIRNVASMDQADQEQRFKIHHSLRVTLVTKTHQCLRRQRNKNIEDWRLE